METASARAQTAEDCRAARLKRTREYIAHLIKYTSMPDTQVKEWTKMLLNKHGKDGTAHPEAPEITWGNFALHLKRTQRRNAPIFHGLVKSGSSVAPERRAVVQGGGTWFADVLLANGDLMDHVCSYIDAASSPALRMTCKLPAAALEKLRAKCPRLRVAGTGSNFPHGRTKHQVAFVGIEKEVGVAVAIAEPTPANVISIGHDKYCISATAASNFRIEGVRDRTWERGPTHELKKIQVQDGEDWHPAHAGRYFKELPTATLELRCADTHALVPGGMMATRSSSCGLMNADGTAMTFTLGARYVPPQRIARRGSAVMYSDPCLCPHGPSVATVYAGFKLSHKLIEPPYRKRRFYIRVKMCGSQIKDGKAVDVETEARGEVFEVRRRAAPAMSDAKRQRLAR